MQIDGLIVDEEACWGCGDAPHPARACFTLCSECGAIASGLTADESDPSVGLYGPGPLCIACDLKAIRELWADSTDPEVLKATFRYQVAGSS